MTTRRAAAALALAAGLAPGAAARELWSRGESSLDYTGSVKEIATFTRDTDASDFALRSVSDPACLLAASFADCSAFDLVGETDAAVSLTRVRQQLEARATPWLSAVLVYDHELRFGALDSLGNALGESFARDSFWDVEWEVHAFGMPTDHRDWSHLLYRAYLKLETRKLEVVAGRQRVPWGVGRLWNPTDRFNAIGPLAVEGDQSLGVDALDVRWIFDGFHSLEAVYVPNGSRDEAAYGARMHGHLRGVDWSLLGGRWDEAWAAGFDLTRNVGGAAVRIEAIWTSPQREVWPIGDAAPEELASFWQIVAGIDHSFDIGSGLYLLVEHLYDGNALGFGSGKAGPLLPFFEATPTPPDGVAPPPGVGPFVKPASIGRFGGSRVVSLARHQTGVQVGYDLTSILRADFLAIYDWNGESAALVPVLSWSPTGSLELSVAAQFFVGPRLSQYGDQEPLLYATAEWFF